MASLVQAEWTEDVRAFFAIYEGEEGRRNGSKYNFARWFANHPDLATNWMRYNAVLSGGVLDPVLREIVVLRTAHLYRCEYEWNLHSQISASLGIGAEDLAAVKVGPTAPRWNDLERTCLQVADALSLEHDIDDALWNNLAARLDRKEIIELLFVVGSYTLLAWVLKAVRMPVEDL